MYKSATYRSGATKRALRAAVGIAAVFVMGCSSGPSRVSPPSIDADDAGEKAVAQYDQDDDGLLSKQELEHCPAILLRMERFDADQDNSVSAAEIAERIRKWQKIRVALLPLGVRITLNGRPLSGAEVRLIPEEFLGDSIQPASGTTDATGMCTPAISADKLPEDLTDFRGVHLGLYQVEVTHPTKKLGDQRLGTEIDHTDQWNGIRFDLKSR
jgi:hypothetical protein